MQPERWRLLQSLFRTTVDLEPADRNAVLARACRDDPLLRRAVEDLLRADDAACFDRHLRGAIGRAAADLTLPDEPASR